jgi:hypothetical protein
VIIGDLTTQATSSGGLLNQPARLPPDRDMRQTSSYPANQYPISKAAVSGASEP